MERFTDAGATAARSESVAAPPMLDLAEIDSTAAIPIPSGLDEVDRVLGGGLVPSSVLLLSGEPGIGKSTLCLQIVQSVASGGASVLLVTGEEAPSQVAGRARRLGPIPPSVQVLDAVDVRSVVAAIADTVPQFVVVDSVQTLHDPDLDGVPGSTNQIRSVAGQLVGAAKRYGVTIMLVGHVTKDGTLAGPRQLEHVVDTVLSFEGDRHHDLRTLRAVKHRFGSTSEVGLFEMTMAGLRPVLDPSARFLSDRLSGAAGSVVVPAMDGHRPVMIEVQALVGPDGELQPQRTAQGLPTSRLRLALAVLGSQAKIVFGRRDVFCSVAGGVTTNDPGVDLGLALALASAESGRPIAPAVVAVAEIGLAGELRSVPRLDLRLQEAYRVGYRTAIVPESASSAPTGMTLVRCRSLADALSNVRIPIGGRF